MLRRKVYIINILHLFSNLSKTPSTQNNKGKGMDGPIVTLSNCCPGLLAKSRQSELRVEGIADFTGVEFVWISDKKIRDAYFPEADWVIVATYCVPSDIAKQLSKVDWMMRGEEEYHVRETDDLVKRIKVDRECFLYKYNDLTSEWEKYAVTIKNRGKGKKKHKDGLFMVDFHHV